VDARAAAAKTTLKNYSASISREVPSRLCHICARALERPAPSTKWPARRSVPAMEPPEGNGGSVLVVSCRSGRNLDRSAGAHRAMRLDRKHALGAETGQKIPHPGRGSLFEQIVVPGTRLDRQRLRVVGRMEDAAGHIQRDDRVAAAMNDEERYIDGADTIDSTVLIDHDLFQGQKRPSQLAHIHDRGERRFQNQTFGLTLLADLGRDASAERLAVEHDVARGGTPSPRSVS